MQSILVFCGANTGRNHRYRETTVELGRTLARRGYEIVYGAGNVGLMGILADAALGAGGTVTGVIPYFLREREVCHDGLTNLHIVDSMHERKLKMAELSDAVMVLPGGYGTLDETFEMLTLSQLGQSGQPVGVLNTDGYYDHLLAHLDRMMEEEFLKPAHRSLLLEDHTIDGLLSKMEAFRPPAKEGKWIRL